MRVSGVGCSVIDLLYDLPPGEDRLAPWLSRARGDGGLVRGGATLKSAFERFTQRSLDAWAREVLHDVVPQRSVGGVCVVALIAAAQLLPAGVASVRLVANVSDDAEGDWFLERLARTPLDCSRIRRQVGRYPTTLVLNERGLDGGERSFVCDAGMPEALALAPADLGPAFFASDVAVFGYAHWEPKLFAGLTAIAAACQRAGALTVVGTAFDASREPGGRAGRWATRTRCTGTWTSSCSTPPRRSSTPGPVPRVILEDRAKGLFATGDTVGCGDNFLGGVVASLALQRRDRRGRLDVAEAVKLGHLSGALASTHRGGVFPESHPGRKRELVERCRAAYDAQLRSDSGA